MSIGESQIEWKPCHRIIPSRFPPIQLFERVTDPADLEAIFAVEALTNPRLRDEVGDIQLVAPGDRVAGAGSSIIMAAFTHLNPEGSRFSNGTFGVFYAASELDTAIAETKYHRERFLRATDQGRMDLDMRAYLVDLAATLHDLRGCSGEFPLVHHAENYAAAQHLAITLRNDGSNGITYDSVRRPEGQCAAVFRPRFLFNCRQGQHLCYVWNGSQITDIYEKRALAG